MGAARSRHRGRQPRREKKEPERPSGSPGAEAPSHRQPLGLWCSKQPPRSPLVLTGTSRRRLARRRSGRLLLEDSPCGASPAAGPPSGSPEGSPVGLGSASSLRRLPSPKGSVPGLATFFGALGSASGLAAFVGSLAPSPPFGGSGTSSDLLESVLRLLGARRTVRAGEGGGQLDVSAGQSMNMQVAGPGKRVTRVNGP